jgi:hypothetical protein
MCVCVATWVQLKQVCVCVCVATCPLHVCVCGYGLVCGVCAVLWDCVCSPVLLRVLLLLLLLLLLVLQLFGIVSLLLAVNRAFSVCLRVLRWLGCGVRCCVAAWLWVWLVVFGPVCFVCERGLLSVAV